MVSLILASVAKGYWHWFGLPYKMNDVVLGITQPPNTIIWYTNVEEFSNNDDLAISAFNLLSYVVGVDAQLGEHCDIFRLRWENLGVPPPYLAGATVLDISTSELLILSGLLSSTDWEGWLFLVVGASQNSERVRAGVRFRRAFTRNHAPLFVSNPPSYHHPWLSRGTPSSFVLLSPLAL